MTFIKTSKPLYWLYNYETVEDRIFHLDGVEFIAREDEDRIAELGLNIDYDMPNGFYIHNSNTYPTSLDVSDETIYLILDWTDLSKHKSLTKEEFVEYNNSIEYSPLSCVYQGWLCNQD